MMDDAVNIMVFSYDIIFSRPTFEPLRKRTDKYRAKTMFLRRKVFIQKRQFQYPKFEYKVLVVK
jgi:hypothetical protein